MDDFEETSEEELFNEDFDDKDTTLRAGIKKRVCPKCQQSLKYRVEGRFVVRYCPDCGHEEED